MSPVNKTLIAIVVVGIVFFLVIALIPINNQADNGLVGVTVWGDQMAFANHYLLGLEYERGGELEQALEQYGEVVEATQPEIADAAKTGVRRVLNKQASWLRILQSQLQTSLTWLLQFLLALILIIIPVAVVWLGWRLLGPRVRGRWMTPGYQLLPFKDLTADNLGQNGHLLLYAVLQDIQRVYQDAEHTMLVRIEQSSFPLLTAYTQSSSDLTDALNIVESVSVSGLGVKLVPLVSTLRRLFDVREHVIESRLFPQGGQLHLMIEIKRSGDDYLLESWSLVGNADLPPTTQTGDLVEQAAYQFLIWRGLRQEGTNPFRTRSWRSLRDYSNALKVRQQYLQEIVDIADLEAAADRLDQTIDRDPHYVEAHYLLGSLYLSLSQYQEAERIFLKLPEEPGLMGRIRAYNLGISIFYQFSGAWTRKKSYSHFEKILSASEKDIGNDQTELFLRGLTHCAVAMIAAVEIDEKRKDWKVEPNSERIDVVKSQIELAAGVIPKLDEEAAKIIEGGQHLALGEAHRRQNKMDEARKVLKQAAANRPYDPLVYVSLAWTYPNQSDERIIWLKKAVEVQPSFEFAHFQLAETYDRQFEADSDNDVRVAQTARRLAQEAYRKARSYAEAQNKLGQYAIKDGDYDKAIQHFEQAVSLNSYHIRAWSNLSYRALEGLELGLLDRSAPLLEQVEQWSHRYLQLVQNGGDKWKGHHQMGWAQLERGKWELAEKSLQTSVTERDNTFRNRYHLARVYQTQGQRKQALEAVTEAIKFSRPNDKFLDQAKQMQRELEYQTGY